jgi:hypothetical protein
LRELAIQVFGLSAAKQTLIAQRTRVQQSIDSRKDIG